MSAFAGSDLEVPLRARGSGHLVLAGIATSGAVLSTLRQAADLDYTVLADGCLDPDPDRADRLHHAASSPAQPPRQRAPARGREAI